MVRRDSGGIRRRYLPEPEYRARGNLTYSYGRGNSEPIALYEGTWSRPDEAMVQFGPECVVFELCLVEGIEDNDLWGQYGPGELHDEICGVWICEEGDGPGTSSLRLTHVQGILLLMDVEDGPLYLRAKTRAETMEVWNREQTSTLMCLPQEDPHLPT